MQDVYIAAVSRTPIGGYNGSLSSLSATELGAIAIKSAVEKIGLAKELVEEIVFGCVLSANLGQNPARQAALGAGLSNEVVATTVNKVCASGLKATIMGAQSIMTGQADIVVTGGMESMSQAPYYLPQQRFGSTYGHGQVVDGVLKDGLTDANHGYAMGVAAELCATTHEISRDDQDDFAIQSYRRAQGATEAGKFLKYELTPVTVMHKKTQRTVDRDEDVFKLDENKLRQVRPAFVNKDTPPGITPPGAVGTVTAPNSSPLSDGAAALVLVSKAAAERYQLPLLARIRGFADAAQESSRFTTSPSLAIPKAVKRAGLSMDQIQFFELNEAFSVVGCANMKLLNLSSDNVNIWGGAVAMGHPLGCSGARILCTLLSVLTDKNATLGACGICNGGGGATAMVIERL
ncbi:unnamed protein product [Absidia cylindrospora]